MSFKKNALIVDDTAANRMVFERLISQANFDVLSAATGRDALAISETLEQLSLAIIDMQMPDSSGLEIVKRLRMQFPSACLVMATMHDERSLMESSFKRGCDVFLVKPHGLMELYKQLMAIGTAGLHEKRPLVFDTYGMRTFHMNADV
ncbi:MAG: response regulator [Aggregatilineales bacterium]